MTLSVRELVKKNSKNYPDKTWLFSPVTGKEITWKNASFIAQNIAENLTLLGLQKGDPVGIAAHNSVGVCLTFLGITYGGFLATPLNLVSGHKAIKYVIEHSKLKFLILSDTSKNLIHEALKDSDTPIKILHLDPDKGPLFTNLADDKVKNLKVNDIKESDPGLLMYTSGTTGKPKGVILSHLNLISSGQNVVNAHCIDHHDRAMCILPIYHINGLCVTVMGTMVSASGLVMPYKFSLRNFWAEVYRFDCSWFSAVPTLFSYLINDEKNVKIDLKRLRFARSASAPLAPEIHRRFESRFGIPIIETMGLTETGAQILSNPMSPKKRKIGSAGQGVGNEIRISGPDLTTLDANIVGEILVRGPNVMKGYLNQPEETAETITPDLWLRTGDLGYMDDDGFVFVTGRIKELIIKGGENIAPREIDEVLLLHEDILEAAAFAVPCKSYGERVEACVILKSRRMLTEIQILEFCQSKLGNFKSPDRIHFKENLPKGPSGKIQRLKLFEYVYKNNDANLTK